MNFEAILIPYQFNQDHPIRRAEAWKGEIFGSVVRFGTQNEYEARLVGELSFDGLAAPCTVRLPGDHSLRCLIEIDPDTEFMVRRYGRQTYANLVRSTVAELQALLDRPPRS